MKFTAYVSSIQVSIIFSFSEAPAAGSYLLPGKGRLLGLLPPASVL